MTKETLQERMTTLSRYFARNKWKAESGFFQYPRGKKRTEAVAEALEIAFDPSEFAIKKELNLRGEDVVGSVFLVAVPTEGIFGGYSYLSLTITDHVFIVTQLPERSVAALALLENSGEKLADAEELIEEYSIETGPFYLTPSSFYENIEDAEGIRKYVFLSEDGAYTLAIGLDVSSCDQEASVLYLHNTEQGIYFFDFDNAVWELLDTIF